MNIPLDGEVHCTDGSGGHAVAAVLDPVAQTVSHIVVDIKGHGSKTFLVPLAMITDSSAKGIMLNSTKDDLAGLEPFMRTTTVEDSMLGIANAQGLAYSEFQSGISVTDFNPEEGGGSVDVEVEAIPDNELAAFHGIPVEATDHQIGKLDELAVEAGSGKITHVVLKEGHLFGKKEIAVPMESVDRIGEVAVYLKLTKDEVERLPHS